MAADQITILYDQLPNTCVDVYNPVSSFQDAEMIATACNNTSVTQQWSYNTTNGEITNKNWKGDCLTEDGAGNLVTLETCTGATNQVWSYDTNQKQIINGESANCLGVDVDVFTGFPNMITQACQFNSTTGADNITSHIFDNGNIPTSPELTNGDVTPESLASKTAKINFIILISLLSIFGAFALGGLGLAIGMTVKNAKKKK